MPKAKKSTPASRTTSPAAAVASGELFSDIRVLIEAARAQAARAVNSALVGLYWYIGNRIRRDILQEERAGYGEQIVPTLSTQLTQEYGRGYDRRNLYHMIRFAELFPDEAIVHALRTQLSWTHFRELLAIDDPLTELPPRELLEKTLHESIRRARERLAIAQHDHPMRSPSPAPPRSDEQNPVGSGSREGEAPAEPLRPARQEPRHPGTRESGGHVRRSQRKPPKRKPKGSPQ